MSYLPSVGITGSERKGATTAERACLNRRSITIDSFLSLEDCLRLSTGFGSWAPAGSSE